MKRFYRASLLLIAFVLLLIACTASSVAAESVSPKITETQISTSGLAYTPAIYGNKIVWTDYRGEECNIYMYDLSTKKETRISTSGMAHGSPAIYGDKIVWGDTIDYGNVHIYDIPTQRDTKIPGNTEKPSIYGDKVVYDNYDSIYIYNLSTSQKTQVIPSGPVYYPAIYGNTIVWDGESGPGKWDTYMYDLSTEEETQITTSGSAGGSTIYGNRIVYADTRNGNTDIYMYDISTKKETQITSSPDAQTSPAIYGNRIVWEDDGGEDDGGTNHGIYMYDISTNQKMKVSTKGSAYQPAIYGDNIVWQYGYYGNIEIYMATVSNPEPKPPVAAFSASPRSGKAPLKVQFTDKSANSHTSWKWSFGDKTYSTAKNPVHKYSKAGKYTVSLTVKNAKGSNTKKMSGYIVAKK